MKNEMRSCSLCDVRDCRCRSSMNGMSHQLLGHGFCNSRGDTKPFKTRLDGSYYCILRKDEGIGLALGVGCCWRWRWRLAWNFLSAFGDGVTVILRFFHWFGRLSCLKGLQYPRTHNLIANLGFLKKLQILHLPCNHMKEFKATTANGLIDKGWPMSHTPWFPRPTFFRFSHNERTKKAARRKLINHVVDY